MRSSSAPFSLTRRFAPEQIVGSVVYTTAMMQAPAHVTVTQRQSLVIGAIGSDNVALRFDADAGAAVRIVGWEDEAEVGALLQILMPVRV